MTDLKSEKEISVTNIIIGTGFLWLLFLLVIPGIVGQFVSYSMSSVKEYATYTLILFSSFALTALVVGIIAGLIIKKNQVLHSAIIGVTSLIMALITMVPAKSFSIKTVLIWVITILPAIIIGSYIGTLIKKWKLNKIL
jgi:hypothetical protein